MRNKYLIFFIKATLIASPIIILLIIYIISDPFKVLYKYNSYYEKENSHVISSKDYISTQTFINNRNKFHYNSFIFGNSRSIYYKIDSWKKFIHTDNCYHFDAFDESLLGINRKIKFIQRKNTTINNALLILDDDILNQTLEKKGPIYLSHPILSDQSWISFQLEYLKTFFLPKFFIPYIDFSFSHRFKNYMKKWGVLDDRDIIYNLKNNEVKYYNEEAINANPTKFYNEKKMEVFYKRDSIQKYSPQVITKAQYQLLFEISQIFKKNNTKYKIIISPLYNQFKLNKHDLLILDHLFGENNVYDFSGINFITNDYHNYYEDSHYRTHIADYIMNEIYK